MGKYYPQNTLIVGFCHAFSIFILNGEIVMGWSEKRYVPVVGTILIGSTVGIFTKSAALYPFLSWHYCLFVGGAILNLGIYAILWQQIIQRIEISTAYMFRGAGVIFCLSFCALIFG